MTSLLFIGPETGMGANGEHISPQKDFHLSLSLSL